MKRLVLAALAAFSSLTGATAAGVYINTGIVDPNDPAPVIDATTFINYGYFGVSMFGEPYGTQNTLYYTNFNEIVASPGFNFDFRAPTNSPPGTKCAWFVNVGSVSEFNAFVYGSSDLRIDATNIIDRGTLAVGGRGLLSI